MKDSMGRFRTKSLFKELSETPAIPTVYTIEEAYQLYMSHQTEYDAAMALVGSWQHWKKLIACKEFFEYLELWREEKEEKLMSEGIKSMVIAASTPDRQGRTNVVAARWLAEKGFKPKDKKKKDKDRDSSAQDRILSNLTNDLIRVKRMKD